MGPLVLWSQSAPRLRRRTLAALMGTAALALLVAGPADAQEKRVLVLGLDISDTRNFDPARMADYSPPVTNGAVYDRLVTQSPGNYGTVEPMLAERWEILDDGARFRFFLRQDVKFWDGSPLTAEDVQFSLHRLLNVKDQPAVYAENLERVEIVDGHTVDLILKDPAQPLMINLAAPAFAIYSKALTTPHGATDAADAQTADTATQWINQNTTSSAAYHMVQWERNASVVMNRNEHWWGGTPPFERIVIRHIGDGAAQLLALRRGDIDMAFNLTAEQVDTIQGEPGIEIKEGLSLDYVYMTLTGNADFNPALAKRENRLAVAHAIDYDGIIQYLINGYAVRPPNFLPIGTAGVTEETTREIGYYEDLDKAREYLAAAGNPDGFEFELSITNAAIVGTNYQLIAQKVQSDLARVGIRANLNPLDPVTLRTRYNGGETQSVITFWNPPSPEPYLWATASIERVARRVHWEVEPEVREVVGKAGAAQDIAERDAYYLEYQKMLQDRGHYIMLLQPIYRLAHRDSITDVELTAAGWHVEMSKIKPAQ
jgi:peptide/nickel transport system substrate-binding protein